MAFRPVSPFECCTPKGICDYLASEGFVFRGQKCGGLGPKRDRRQADGEDALARDCNVTVLT
jgi:hypothetical protein